jgi:hypothetical protein
MKLNRRGESTLLCRQAASGQRLQASSAVVVVLVRAIAECRR